MRDLIKEIETAGLSVSTKTCPWVILITFDITLKSTYICPRDGTTKEERIHAAPKLDYIILVLK